jgi:hypothetical protein
MNDCEAKNELKTYILKPSLLLRIAKLAMEYEHGCLDFYNLIDAINTKE